MHGHRAVLLFLASRMALLAPEAAPLAASEGQAPPALPPMKPPSPLPTVWSPPLPPPGVLDSLQQRFGVDVRPQKSLVKELLVDAMHAAAAAQ